MMILRLRPTDTVASILDIDFESLYDLGKRAILIDFDGTLAKRGASELPQASANLLANLLSMGFHAAVLTNRRAHRTIDGLPIPVLYHARKPKRAGYLTLLHQLSSQPSECVAIGDRFITDVLGGNRLGLYTIRVRDYPVGI